MGFGFIGHGGFLLSYRFGRALKKEWGFERCIYDQMGYHETEHHPDMRKR